MNLTFIDLHLLAGADYVKSIEYSSELLRKISKIWEVLARRNYTDNSIHRTNSGSAMLPKFLKIFNSELYSIDFT